MKTIHYKTSGTCSEWINITIAEDNTIEKVEFIGGCNGNTQGICHLVNGEKVNTIIKKSKGIRCKEKQTSCPDQLATALEEISKQ